MGINGRKRLLYIINSSNYFLSHRSSIALRAKEKGFQIHVASPKDEVSKKLEKNGFRILTYQDMSDNWSEVTQNRINSYINNKDRHLRVHDKNIVNSLISFYSFISNYFSNDKIGGIRVSARKSDNK